MKLKNKADIAAVIKEMTIDEKLNLVGAYKACHTLAIPRLDIPALCLMDGATGVNGVQLVLDYLTDPTDKETSNQDAYANDEMVRLNKANLEEERAKYQDNEEFLGLIDHIEKFRPAGKEFVSFPSGINIGATFNQEMAHRIGEAVGKEMRNSQIDICLGPNVDIMRDPLGGRNYEMYGEDPHLVKEMSVGFIKGMQGTGVGACAKHFIANNQETNRNTKNTHVSTRTLKEIYSKGFMGAIQEAKVKAIMSAYNAVNGTFSSYNKTLLTDWLREEWKFEGMVVSDWGAASDDKERALEAGLDLILNGPNDMSACKQAVEQGTLSMAVLDQRVNRILTVIAEIKQEQESILVDYDQAELLQSAYHTIVDGAVLLKNAHNTLPLNPEDRIAFYGKRSKDPLEFGSGSTAVWTNLHSNLFDEYKEHFGDKPHLFETIENADTLVYTVAAPAGENADREVMDIEKEDRLRIMNVLREAKEAGLKTVVVLNVSGPVDVRSWEPYADSILTIFIPGCMGGKATFDLLFGTRSPAGKLPVTFPMRYEDTPSYPNFPGEPLDVYYGEGIFVGYRNYEKRKIAVQYPFGYGLTYSEFDITVGTASLEFNTIEQDQIEVPVTIKNIGQRFGSEVIQVYGSEIQPKVLRPEKELWGFSKVALEPGEETTISVKVAKTSLQYYDEQLQKWVIPIGEQLLQVGTSSQDILTTIALQVEGINEYSLGPNSTIQDILRNPQAVQVVNAFTGGMFDLVNEEQLNFMLYRKLSDILSMSMIALIPDTVKLNKMLQDLYEQLKAIS